MDEIDTGLHRSAVYSVGGVRAWIESLGQMQPHVEVQGDPKKLPAEEMRAFAVVLQYLADLADPS